MIIPYEQQIQELTQHINALVRVIIIITISDLTKLKVYIHLTLLRDYFTTSIYINYLNLLRHIVAQLCYI